MSDRSVKVQITADTSAYLEAMKVATEATDNLRSTIKELRREQNDVANSLSTSWPSSQLADAVFELLDAGISREDIKAGALAATLDIAKSAKFTSHPEA